MGFTSETRPHREVDIVHSREDAPRSIDLGKIPVDFRRHQEDDAKEDRERGSGDERVRLEVDLDEGIAVRVVVEELLGEVVELGEEGFDGLVEVGALFYRLKGW